MTSKKNSAASKAVRQRVAKKSIKTKADTAPSELPPSLLRRFMSNMAEGWSSLFRRQKSFTRFSKTLLALLVCPGRKTMTNAFHAMGHTHEGWRADYANVERTTWRALDIFKPVLLKAARRLGSDDLIEIAADDTCLDKTGLRIPDVSTNHDPLAPKWMRQPTKLGIRMLHTGIIMKDAQNRPMIVTIGFLNAPPEPKLKAKKGQEPTKEEKSAYRKREKEKRVTTRLVAYLNWVRDVLDKNEMGHRKIRLIVDGAYTNSVVIPGLPHDTEIVGRFRKSSKIYRATEFVGKWEANPDAKLPEPQYYLREIPTTLLQQEMLHVGGRLREVNFADIPGIQWGPTLGRLMRMILVKPLPYERVGQGDAKRAEPIKEGEEAKIPRRRKKFYNEPSYLITTDLVTPAGELIQSYLYRWQIEQLHREMKTDLGIGQVQAFREAMNSRIHSAQAACYAMLNLTSLDLPPGKFGEDRPRLPGWRRLPPMRVTCHELITRLRNDLIRDNILLDPEVGPVPLPAGWGLTAKETYQTA